MRNRLIQSVKSYLQGNLDKHCANIENLLDDANTIDNIKQEINKFIQRGINLESSIIPLENQYTEKCMDSLGDLREDLYNELLSY